MEIDALNSARFSSNVGGLKKMIGALLTKMMVRRGCTHLNSRDINKFLKQWHEDAIFIYPGVTHASGEHHGRDQIRKWWSAFYKQFPSSIFTTQRIYIKNIMSVTATNQVALEWSVRVKNQSGDMFNNHGVSLVDIYKGKINRFEDFIFDLETLKRAWEPNKSF